MRSLLLVLALAPLVPAQFTVQLTPQQASKQARAAAKLALAQLKTDLATARDTFVVAIDAVEGNFTAGNGMAIDLEMLFIAADAFQSDVQAAVLAATDDAAAGVEEALAALAQGVPLDGAYPKDLQLGTSGVCDDTNVAVEKLLAKTYASLDKRLNKTEAIVAAAGTLVFRATLKAPGGSLPHAASEGLSQAALVDFGIDTLWAMRDVEDLDAGTVLAAGPDATALIGPGLTFSTLEVGAGAVNVTDAEAAAGPGRWAAQISALPRGSYLCSIAPADGVVTRASSFGMP